MEYYDLQRERKRTRKEKWRIFFLGLFIGMFIGMNVGIFWAGFLSAIKQEMGKRPQISITPSVPF